MATKKKSKKKQIKTKRSAAVIRKPVRKTAKKKPLPKKKLAKKKSPSKKLPSKKALAKTSARKKKTVARIVVPAGNRTSSRTRDLDAEVSDSQEARTRSAGQSGGLQGLSNRAGADSESVDELIEEGNAFEADVVAGVESADDTDGEVHTREVPEDDVPQEYLDED